MRRIKLILAATALMVAMLAATAVPVFADEEEIENLRGGCFAVVEEEDDDGDLDEFEFGHLRGFVHDHDHDFDDNNGDEDEEIKAIYCPRVNVFGNVEYERVD
jgi:hypothetical protein